MTPYFLTWQSGPIVQTDGRETERLNRSSAPPPNAQFPQDDGYGRLYRVDSQMFEMDDEFVELSADMDGDRPDHVGVCLKYLLVFKLILPQIVLEEYDENGNPIQVLSSNVVYTQDHVAGQHGITSRDHFTHATSSAEPYSQYTREDVFEFQEFEEFEPPPQVTSAHFTRNQPYTYSHKIFLTYSQLNINRRIVSRRSFNCES